MDQGGQMEQVEEEYEIVSISSGDSSEDRVLNEESCNENEDEN